MIIYEPISRELPNVLEEIQYSCDDASYAIETDNVVEEDSIICDNTMNICWDFYGGHVYFCCSSNL
jgi:hypothetical protein